MFVLERQVSAPHTLLLYWGHILDVKHLSVLLVFFNGSERLGDFFIILLKG